MTEMIKEHITVASVFIAAATLLVLVEGPIGITSAPAEAEAQPPAPLVATNSSAAPLASATASVLYTIDSANRKVAHSQILSDLRPDFDTDTLDVVAR